MPLIVRQHTYKIMLIWNMLLFLFILITTVRTQGVACVIFFIHNNSDNKTDTCTHTHIRHVPFLLFHFSASNQVWKIKVFCHTCNQSTQENLRKISIINYITIFIHNYEQSYSIYMYVPILFCWNSDKHVKYVSLI